MQAVSEPEYALEWGAGLLREGASADHDRRRSGHQCPEGRGEPHDAPAWSLTDAGRSRADGRQSPFGDSCSGGQRGATTVDRLGRPETGGDGAEQEGFLPRSRGADGKRTGESCAPAGCEMFHVKDGAVVRSQSGLERTPRRDEHRRCDRVEGTRALSSKLQAREMPP